MAQRIAPIAIIGLWLVSIVGWCMNIWALYDSVGGSFNAMVVARYVGVLVAPLGAILGYF